MAIYKNREVHVIGPNVQANSPETINVSYKDGTHENVKLSDVKFTEDEKKNLQKAHPSKYDSVSTVSNEDVEAVRVGVAPPSDPTFQEQAKLKAQHEKQVKMNQDQVEKAKKAQEAEVDKEAKSSTSQTSKAAEADQATHQWQVSK